MAINPASKKFLSDSVSRMQFDERLKAAKDRWDQKEISIRSIKGPLPTLMHCAPRLMILRLPETLNSNMCQTIEEANLAKEYYGFMWMGKRVGNPFPCLRWDIARNTLKQVKLY